LFRAHAHVRKASTEACQQRFTLQRTPTIPIRFASVRVIRYFLATRFPRLPPLIGFLLHSLGLRERHFLAVDAVDDESDVIRDIELTAIRSMDLTLGTNGQRGTHTHIERGEVT